MSTSYTTYQQHEPLRAPAGWSVQEKRFVAQLEELFDDIYKRYNRLRLEDMSPDFRKAFKKIQDDGSEMMTQIEANATGISTLVTKTGINNVGQGETLYSKISQNATSISSEVNRATTAEGTLRTAITQSATSIMTTVERTYLSKTDASSTYATKSEIVQDDTSWKATFKKIGASGYTAEGITTITENGITVTHSSLSNCKTEMSASGFRILNSSNAVIGGLMSLNNQVVTAMNTLYNPSYPNFNMGVGSYTPQDKEGTTSGQGLSLKYGGVEFLHIGKNIYSPGYAQTNELFSSQSLWIAVNGGLSIQRLGGGAIFFSSSGDIEFTYKDSYGISHTKRISELEVIPG